jgi:hypothetical protein
VLARATAVAAFGAAVPVLFLAFAVAGLLVALKQSPLICVLIRADCSTALATWTAACVALAAFLAAVAALNLERKPSLGINRCSDDGHRTPRMPVYIIDATEASFYNVPPLFPETAFEALLHFDFENLGRSALLNVEIELHLTHARHSKSHMAWIGSIGVDKAAHVSVYYLIDAFWPSLQWSSTAKASGVTTQLGVQPLYNCRDLWTGAKKAPASIGSAGLARRRSHRPRESSSRWWQVEARRVHGMPNGVSPGRARYAWGGLVLVYAATAVFGAIFGSGAAKHYANDENHIREDRWRAMYTERHVNSQAYDLNRLIRKKPR